MSGHTPGPWTQSKIIPTAVDDALHFIVECRVIDNDIETAIANARLIAAAPDLLEALKLIASCESKFPGDVVDIAKKALLKANKK